MIFKRIQFQNLLAYNGKQEIDLSGCTKEKNIILVSGRNGTGKTSFINAIKLLFLGSNDRRLRSVGFPPTTLSVTQFVRGVPGVWSGLINTQACRDSVDRASISIVWEDEAGNEIDARRNWILDGPSFVETVDLFQNGAALLQEDVSLQLEEQLPRDFVPFFFFDGEQIRELAEAEEAVTAGETERILNLSFVGEIEQGVSEFVRQRRREALPEETQVRIRRAEGEFATKKAERAAADKRLNELNDVIREDEFRKRQLTLERDELRTGVSDADRRLLEHRLDALERQRAELSRSLSETLPTEAPFLANTVLTEHVYQVIDNVVAIRVAQEVGKFGKLRRNLANRLLDEKPHPDIPLAPSQVAHLRSKLNTLLDEYISDEPIREIPLFLQSLDLANAQRLRDRFLIWIREGQNKKMIFANELQRMRKLGAEAQRTKDELDTVSVASEGHLQRYREISSELLELDNHLASAYEGLGKIEAELASYERELTDIEKEIRTLENEHKQALMTSETVLYARRVGAVLQEYRARQRELRRDSVEGRINEKLQVLLADHRQIRRIKLNDKFVMTYYDEHDEKIGRASISAGMKQLVATALLWALKEESGKTIPLVIDTPLARIDRRNRGRLVECYYPNAGEQVIVLPTDSEIDDSQLLRLSPHIAKKYRIENVDGESAKFVIEGSYI